MKARDFVVYLCIAYISCDAEFNSSDFVHISSLRVTPSFNTARFVFVSFSAQIQITKYFQGGFFDFLFTTPSAKPAVNACNCKCGVPNRRQRLLGGTELKPYEFPWLAQILAEDSPPIEATLINDRYVITSASSVFGYSPFMMKVAMGIHDNCYADITSNTYSVSNLYIHPEFQYVSHENDIALLRLSSAVQFQKRIAPVCLPTPSINASIYYYGGNE